MDTYVPKWINCIICLKQLWLKILQGTNLDLDVQYQYTTYGLTYGYIHQINSVLIHVVYVETKCQCQDYAIVQ